MVDFREWACCSMFFGDGVLTEELCAFLSSEGLVREGILASPHLFHTVQRELSGCKCEGQEYNEKALCFRILN